MSDFNQFMHYRALASKYDTANEKIAEAFMESDEKLPIQTRNVCAKLTQELSDRIDYTAARLGINKRLFIERSLIEAMDQVDIIFDQMGIPEPGEQA
jgi:uncharacterized membrane protein YebE (DUF533 family)